MGHRTTIVFFSGCLLLFAITGFYLVAERAMAAIWGFYKFYFEINAYVYLNRKAAILLVASVLVMLPLCMASTRMGGKLNVPSSVIMSKAAFATNLGSLILFVTLIASPLARFTT